MLPGRAGAETAYVSIANNAFTPASVQVQMGPPEAGFPLAHAHVQFVMVDQGTQHNVVFDDPNIQRSPDLTASQIHDAVFTAPGTFPYGCTIHPTMRGTVVVTEMPVTTTTTTLATTTTTAAPATTVPTTAAPTPASTVAGAVTPRTTAVRRAAPSTVATAAPTTTDAPAATTLPETTTTAVPETTTTTQAVGLPDGGRKLSVAATRDDDASSGPSWPLVALFVVLAGAAAILAARRFRHRPPPLVDP